MRFDLEPWRKLYVTESVEHRLLPLFSRGLRDYLIRLAEADGTLLHSTDDPVRDLVRALAAGPDDRKRVGQAIEDLKRVGYLTYRGRRLWITKFTEAQARQSPGAKRQAAYSARQRAKASLVSVTSDVTNDVSPDVRVNVSPVSPVTSQTKRNETKREEPPTPLPGKLEQMFGGELPHQREDVADLFRLYKSTFGLADESKLIQSDGRAYVLAQALDAYGWDACALVLNHAKRDGMVNGKQDEHGQKHETIQYILGNPNTFDRILKAARERDGKSGRKLSATEAVEAARRL